MANKEDLEDQGAVVLKWHIFFPQGIFSNDKRHFQLSQVEMCYCHLVGRGQGGCQPSFKVQDSPPQQRIIWTPKDGECAVRKLWFRRRSRRSDLVLPNSIYELCDFEQIT